MTENARNLESDIRYDRNLDHMLESLYRAGFRDMVRRRAEHEALMRRDAAMKRKDGER